MEVKKIQATQESQFKIRHDVLVEQADETEKDLTALKDGFVEIQNKHAELKVSSDDARSSCNKVSADLTKQIEIQGEVSEQYEKLERELGHLIQSHGRMVDQTPPKIVEELPEDMDGPDDGVRDPGELRCEIDRSRE